MEAEARLIVFEQRGDWAATFRRLQRQHAGRVVEARSLAECAELLCREPNSFVALEATPENAETVLQWLAAAVRGGRQGEFVILARGLQPASQWAFREAGAAHVVFRRRQLDVVWNMALRHFDRPADDSAAEAGDSGSAAG